MSDCEARVAYIGDKQQARRMMMNNDFKWASWNRASEKLWGGGNRKKCNFSIKSAISAKKCDFYPKVWKKSDFYPKVWKGVIFTKKELN